MIFTFFFSEFSGGKVTFAHFWFVVATLQYCFERLQFIGSNNIGGDIYRFLCLVIFFGFWSSFKNFFTVSVFNKYFDSC